MNKLGVYKLELDCGRMGSLTGLFIEESDHVDYLLESKIEAQFGEVLGKHSDIHCTIDEGDISLCSDDPEVVRMVQKTGMWCGYNPFHQYPLDFDYEEAGIKEEEEMDIQDLITALLKKAAHNPSND